MNQSSLLGGQQQSQQIDLSQSPGIVCEECNCSVFVPVILLRKISRFVTGRSADSILPIESFSCQACNHINSDMLPPGIKVSYGNKSDTIIFNGGGVIK